MSEHISAERMHDLVDGSALSAEAGGELEHLEGCAECRDQLAALSDLVADLRTLPTEAKAPDHLWQGIAARMEGEAGGVTSDVVALEGQRARRRVAFTLPQLAAAGLVVSLLSAGTVWMVMNGGGAGSPTLAEAPVTIELGHAARAASAGGSGYAAALTELEVLVQAGRDVLAPETVAALDESLRTIDEALAAVSAALADDPSSEVLARMLVNHQRSKLRLLRQAAISVQART